MSQAQDWEQRHAALELQVEQLRAEIDRVDDWANGLFVVLCDLLPPLLKAQPEIAASLAPRWKDVAARFDAAAAQTGQADDYEPLEQLEARKKLYRIAEQLGAWP
ncbi:hypothetical protein R0381_003623 [Jeongeupia wiesaeckerbachi]|uniref:hypothetical protein n=1 Tax=Jeongeupia wiesaeckerbachi TaxID=3051218 RepID=UPI003D80056E